MGARLVLGGSGYVGRELVERLGYESVSRSGSDGGTVCDATRAEALDALLAERRPELVVNCVGLADVDAAERDPTLADQLNRQVVELLAAAQRRFRFGLVHISTDYVFDGATGRYREDSPTHPINIYGASKLAGEALAREVPGALVLRISSPFGRGLGARKVPFFRYVLDTFRAGGRPKALVDQTITPTFLPDLAQAIDRLWQNGRTGLFHIGGEHPMTRYQFATEIAKAAGQDPALIEAVSSSAMTQWVARRPVDTSLDVRKSLAAGASYTPVPAALASLVAASIPEPSRR